MLALYHDRYFPYQDPKHLPFKHLATLGIGGNLGDVRARFEKLFFHLQRDRRIHVVETSPILQNPPFGYLDQPDFYNAIMIINTPLAPQVLLKYLLSVERRFKRTRAFENSPRTLDIDMIFYDKISIDTRYLTLPHPYFHQRESVLIPLSFINTGV